MSAKSVSVVQEFNEHRKGVSIVLADCLQNLVAQLDPENDDYVLKEKILLISKLIELDEKEELFYSNDDCSIMALFLGAFEGSTGEEYNEFAHLALIEFIDKKICPISASITKRIFWIHHNIPEIRKVATSGNAYLQRYPYYLGE